MSKAPSSAPYRPAEVRAVFDAAEPASRGAGLKVAEIADALGASQADRPRLRRALASLVERGVLVRIARGQYALSEADSSAASATPSQAKAAKSAAKAKTKTSQAKPAKGAAKAKTSQAKAAKGAAKAKTKTKTSQAKPEKSVAKGAAKAKTSQAKAAKGAAKAKTKTKTSQAKAAKGAAKVKTKPSQAKAAKGAAKAKGQPEPAAQPEPIRAAKERASAPAAPAVAVDPARTGRITVHPAGYGFVDLEDGQNSAFIPARARGSALDGDRVVVDMWPGYKGPEGRVIEVLSRGRAKLTGILSRAGRHYYLEPDDPRIATDYGHVPLRGGAPRSALGQAAVIEITRYPSDAQPELEGRLARVLGAPEDPRTEIEKILVMADLSLEFPEDAARQAEAVSEVVTERDFADRVDLRDRRFVTIDPETARDFDDALCVEDGPHGGPRVWIAVADVSHYVRADDALDREAIVRGVSVYLPDRVVPMLPLKLSAGICSLNPEVERCAMVVRLDLDSDGTIRDTDFAAAIIRSHARLDYPGVAAALSGDFRGQRDRYRPWASSLARLNKLAQAMRRRRMERGALNLNLPEARIILDHDDPDLVRDVVKSKGVQDVKQAYELVEEFMIAANEAVGGYFGARGLTTVWRVHAAPNPERLDELAPVLAGFGIKVTPEMIEAATSPRGMRRIMAAIGDHRVADSLAFLVLRSLKQAIYDTQPIGHFGLASSSYLHFTSPIRRYADLLVHRLLKYSLHRDGKPSGGGIGFPPAGPEQLAELAAVVSGHERRALQAEREAVAMYRAHFMRDQIGEIFSGRVSAVTSFGAFVELDEPYVEGLIKLESLGDDVFGYDASAMRIRGRYSGLSLRLGDRVTVETIDVSVSRRRVDFRLVSVERQPDEGAADDRSQASAADAGSDPGRSRSKRRRDAREQRAAKQARAGERGPASDGRQGKRKRSGDSGRTGKARNSSRRTGSGRSRRRRR